MWRNDRTNLRGDVSEMVADLEGDDRMDAESDLTAVAQRRPAELTPVVPELIAALEANTFSAYDESGTTATRILTPVAREDPQAFEGTIEELFALLEIQGEDPRSETATDVLATLAKQGFDGVVSNDDRVIQYLDADDPEIRRRGATVLRPRISTVYDRDPSIATTLGAQLGDERSLDTAATLARTTRTLVDDRPDAITQLKDSMPSLVTLIQQGDPAYEYGDVDTYDYRDDRHYDTYQLHKEALGLLAPIADHTPDAITPVIPTLVEMLQTPGSRNTSIRSGAARVLQSALTYPTADLRGALETYREVFAQLVTSDDQRVASAAVEALFVIGDAQAEATLREKGPSSLAGDLAERAVSTLSTQADGDVEPAVRTASLPAADAIERSWYRRGLQDSYEHLRDVGTARKSGFIDAAYPEDAQGCPDEGNWWRAVRSGLKDLPDVELSHNTYEYVGPSQ